MNKENQLVLVTGADGFIGSHLVEYLVQEGYTVRAFCLYNSFGSYGWLDTISADKKTKIEFVLGDIRDAQVVKEAMKGVNVVYHLAALITIPFSYKAPESYIDTNIKGTLNVLQAAKELDVSRVLVTSTSEVYGTAQYVPIDEKHPKNGQSPYAATKIGADALALSFYKSYDLPVTIVRPFNTYGPRQSTRGVIATVISQLKQNRSELKLGNLKPTRDFLFVEDTVRAFEMISRMDDLIGEEVNIASQSEISMEDLVGNICSLMHKKVTIQQDQKRMRPEASEVYRLFGDATKLQSITDWKPEVSLEEGLQRTIDWFLVRE